MTTTKKFIALTVGAVLLFTFACKKDKTVKSGLPELSTIEVTNILATTAMSGGNITSNGGESVVNSGVCWSKTNNNPTVSDDTTKTATTSGSFTAMLKNLSSSSTYYVRAYATNRNGTGYGNVVTFSTGNAAPVATAVSISGDAKAGALITGNYSYSDAESDAELNTSFQWYEANDAAGLGEVAIVGATSKTFRLTDAQQGKYIRFGVTPKAAAGNQNGTEVKSSLVGAVGEATTVTFTYNGQEVTYGIIIGTSGKKWLDRNLGASRVAETANDYQAFGDLFQWGRLADGHQRISRTSSTDAGTSGVTGTTATTTDQDIPPTDKFIISSSLKGDWRIPQNNNFWQGLAGINNPCPTGWRVPTEAEWVAEGIANMSQGHTKLKLVNSGARDLATGTFNSNGSLGWYWTSTVDPTDAVYSVVVGIDATSFFSFGNNRAYGFACRCIKQ